MKIFIKILCILLLSALFLACGCSCSPKTVHTVNHSSATAQASTALVVDSMTHITTARLDTVVTTTALTRADSAVTTLHILINESRDSAGTYRRSTEIKAAGRKGSTEALSGSMAAVSAVATDSVAVSGLSTVASSSAAAIDDTDTRRDTDTTRSLWAFFFSIALIALILYLDNRRHTNSN